MMIDKEYTIIVADDHEIMLDGLSKIINSEPGLKVIGTAKNGKELVGYVETVIPDICIIDIEMPEMNGLQASELLLKKYEGIKILILTMYKEKSILKKVRDMGIKGYVNKTCDSDELIFAIRQILKGKTYFSEDGFEQSNKTVEINSSEMMRISSLTKRELEIIKLLCEGYTNSKIARSLFISKKTVDNHRNNIMKKLEVHNVVELTRLCIKNNLL
ncbi:MAG: response regulator transcription factor [Bacteroidales bacterium]|nr:response regulator transcription factor [Bacteroidales bacterium]